MDRCVTYIQGLDGLIGGGLPRNSITLITGMPGTGKTIMGLQYLYNGANKGENGLYVTIESSAEALRLQAKSLGMDFYDLEKKGKVMIFGVPTGPQKYALFKLISDAAAKVKAKRIVFDNLATLGMHLGKLLSMWTENMDFAKSMTSEQDRMAGIGMASLVYSVIEGLRQIDATSIIITSASGEPGKMSNDGVSEYLCDAVIQLFNTPIGIKYSRSLHISKMRRTDHSRFVHDFEITDKGVSVIPLKAVYNE